MVLITIITICIVALRKESVDRKFHRTINIQRPTAVALRKESVDRKINGLEALWNGIGSLSARRAWIENHSEAGKGQSSRGRSPQGERG